MFDEFATRVSYENLKNTLKFNSQIINAIIIVTHTHKHIHTHIYILKEILGYCCDSAYLVRICYCNHRHFCLDLCELCYECLPI